ncbi:hypothetical protein BGZ79_009875 [Entomortierella chlamydospora]|nr:hypothetical protein BGZ79_009875 [Entomortierella chlamydospora]
MSHSYMMDTESLHPESAPMTPLPSHPSPASTSSPASTPSLPASVPLHPHPVTRVKSTKAHVPSACINCKKAHLACDLSRPCKRCISVGKDDTCRDVEHKKRGRPKLVDKTVAIDGAWVAKDGSSATSKSTVSASALAKTRVKGKYTKSANYKMPKKSLNDPKASSNFVVPQSDVPPRDSPMDNHQSLSSSYPSHPELERPSSAMSYRSHQSSGQNYQGRPLSIHSEPPLPGDHQDPFYYSSTSQIKRPQEMYSAPSSAPLATVFLTMDLICARVSDESQVLWGYHPHDISHKSLYSIIANEDHGKMRHLVGLIKDAIFSAISPKTTQHLAHFPFLGSSSPVFYQNRPGIMSSSAPGASEYTDVIRVCHADGGSDLFSVRMYVGGGLGTDLLRGLNMEHAYVVCIMARHSPPMLNDHHPRSNERLSLDESRTTFYNNTHSLPSVDSQYPSKQPLFSTSDPVSAAESSRKISLPPIFTGGSSSNVSSLPSPSGQSPLSVNSPNGRASVTFGSSAPSSSLPSLSSSYTVPLSKPSSHSTSLPSLRTGPLHTARWLYDPEPFGGSSHSSHNTSGSRLPTMFSDSLRSISAPMGGFGVSKYLNRSDPSPSFNHIKRHQLPLPSPMQGPRSADSVSRTPRSLQRDLSSSSLGASFASRSPPSMKRSLADMADSQDRNRDIDNRHQDHYQHQSSRSGSSSALLSSSLPSMSRMPYQQSLKSELQSMPPDHPTIDPSSSGVCPIVHGSQQRERVQQAQMQATQQTRELDMKDSQSTSIESERGTCRWAKLTDQWRDCRDNGPPGHDCFSSRASDPREREHEHEHEHGRECDADASSSKGYFDYEASNPMRHHSHSPGGHRSYPGEKSQNGVVNPFSTGPSSPTENYSHYRSGSSLRRTSSVGRSSYISRNKGPVVCLTGACGAVCRCSGEDEETRAVKAMDAARKRMSVHSLLC